MTPQRDPSRSSYYMDDAWYDWLMATFSAPCDDGQAITDPALRDACRQVLEREARTLDEWRLGDWLAMFTPECACWAPATKPAGDPRREIAVVFDDRRRMEDRVYRLETDFAWSQHPRARTVRMVTNTEVFRTDAEDAAMTRSTFLTTEFRDGDIRHLSGWNAHYLKQTADGWRIVVRQVNLINCDQNLRNPSLIL